MIIRPFNAGFFLLVAIMIGAIVLLWRCCMASRSVGARLC